MSPSYSHQLYHWWWHSRLHSAIITVVSFNTANSVSWWYWLYLPNPLRSDVCSLSGSWTLGQCSFYEQEIATFCIIAISSQELDYNDNWMKDCTPSMVTHALCDNFRLWLPSSVMSRRFLNSSTTFWSPISLQLCQNVLLATVWYGQNQSMLVDLLLFQKLKRAAVMLLPLPVSVIRIFEVKSKFCNLFSINSRPLIIFHHGLMAKRLILFCTSRIEPINQAWGPNELPDVNTSYQSADSSMELIIDFCLQFVSNFGILCMQIKWPDSKEVQTSRFGAFVD